MENKYVYLIKSNEKLKYLNNMINMIPVKISIIIFCSSIFLLQHLHFPFSFIKLNKGIKS